MELTTIRRMIDVKKSEVSRPAESPFWAVMRATSPLDIIPMPILRESFLLNPRSFALPPQPITLATSATSVKRILKTSSFAFIAPKLVLSPIPVKNSGAKTM